MAHDKFELFQFDSDDEQTYKSKSPAALAPQKNKNTSSFASPFKKEIAQQPSYPTRSSSFQSNVAPVFTYEFNKRSTSIPISPTMAMPIPKSFVSNNCNDGVSLSFADVFIRLDIDQEVPLQTEDEIQEDEFATSPELPKSPVIKIQRREEKPEVIDSKSVALLSSSLKQSFGTIVKSPKEVSPVLNRIEGFKIV